MKHPIWRVSNVDPQEFNRNWMKDGDSEFWPLKSWGMYSNDHSFAQSNIEQTLGYRHLWAKYCGTPQNKSKPNDWSWFYQRQNDWFQTHHLAMYTHVWRETTSKTTTTPLLVFQVILQCAESTRQPISKISGTPGFGGKLLLKILSRSMNGPVHCHPHQKRDRHVINSKS